MTHRLFIVTAGTVAAGVGQEIMRQMKAHPQSDLMAMVRYIDTARLTNRYSMRDGEWFQMKVDPAHMKAIAIERKRYPRLDQLLYDKLLPKPTGHGGGSIRYNGAGAVIVNRDSLKKWLSANMTDLIRLGDYSRNFSVALIVSAVGATGSGSLEYLADVIVDAAQDANVVIPIHMDIFILQPGMEGVSQLGLANTLALYAELAASRVVLNDVFDKQYQGRIIMVGWGSSSSLASIEQLEETAATLVRIINDPASFIVAEYQEREIDNHVLLHVDELTALPTHLSSVTPVIISLGRLEEQIVQRDIVHLLNRIAFGGAPTEKTPLALDNRASESYKDTLFGPHAKFLRGNTPEESYEHLMQSFSEGISLGSLQISASQIVTLPVREQIAILTASWERDTRELNQRKRSNVQERGKTILESTINIMLLLRSKYISEWSSLADLRDGYRQIQAVFESILKQAQKDTQVYLDNDTLIEREINALGQFTLFGKQSSKQRTLEHVIALIQRNLSSRLSQEVNIVAIQVLEALIKYCTNILSSLESLLVQLHRQQDKKQDTGSADQQQLIETGHPLHLAALSSYEEIIPYIEQVSIFGSYARSTMSAHSQLIQGEQSYEDSPLVAFCKWLEDKGQLEALFKGDADLLFDITQSYVRQHIHIETQKYTIVDVLLQAGEEVLLQRMKEAAARAESLVNFSRDYASDLEEARYVSAYCKNEKQREILQRIIDQVFGKGQCLLLNSNDPSEIVIVYSVDGLSMSAVTDFTGRCLDAFLNLRNAWYRYARSSGNSSVDNPGQRVSIPIYSGQGAQERVIEAGIISRLYQLRGKDTPIYSPKDMPELSASFPEGEIANSSEDS